MPQFFPFADDPTSHDHHTLDSMDLSKHSQKHTSSKMWDKFNNWRKKEEDGEPPPSAALSENNASPPRDKPSPLDRRSSARKAVTGLPRDLTFARQNSEKRDRLMPVEPQKDSRRALSVGRAVGRFRSNSKRTQSPPPPVFSPSVSAPDLQIADGQTIEDPAAARGENGSPMPQEENEEDLDRDTHQPRHDPVDPVATNGELTDLENSSEAIDDVLLQQELEAKWILNLSMHFRDQSDREKFFVTYAEEPNKWRRVTVSCDYRDITPDSLEADLKSLHYQRDKSSRIYESIRDSLPDIQFYDTVTNLKLQTDEGRLHVHVTEDVNEIIPYPLVSAVSHLPGQRVSESAVNFESHISGFVYKVSVNGRVFIKKEIPGPDTVEEFLYEVNALYRLRDSRSVIKYEGLIIDDKGERVKGLLISYAEQGALVDMIFDWKNTKSLNWMRRERWARQIVEGLSEIHEAGFVQGDFTLSNIVVDANDNAKIIDINRRGCPVGWEPPELTSLIERNQRISIYIGVKSDVFQLGMVLWALMEEEDEPERQERPLEIQDPAPDDEIPLSYRRMVQACLSERPQDRPSPRELLQKMRLISDEHSIPLGASHHSLSTHRSDKEYIDPSTAVGLEDIDLYRRGRDLVFQNGQEIAFADGNTNRTSTSYPYGSSGYSIIPGQTGSPTSASALTSHSRRRTPHDFSPDPARKLSIQGSDTDGHGFLDEPNWEKIDVDTDTRMEQRANPNVLNESIFPEVADFGRHVHLPAPKEAMKQLTFDEDVPGISQRTPKKSSMLDTTDDATPRAPKAIHFEPEPQPPRDLAAIVDLQTTDMSPEIPLLPHERSSPADSVPLLPHERPASIFGDSLYRADPSPTSSSSRKVSLDFPAFHRGHAVDIDGGSPSSRDSGSGSFHDRVHNRRSHDSHLAELETEVLSAPTPAPQRRDSRPFGPPLHHDSGFHEPGTLSATNSFPLDWAEKAKNGKIDELKKFEERQERRRLSAEMDEKRARDGIKEMLLRAANGNAGNLSTGSAVDGGASQTSKEGT